MSKSTLRQIVDDERTQTINHIFTFVNKNCFKTCKTGSVFGFLLRVN